MTAISDDDRTSEGDLAPAAGGAHAGPVGVAPEDPGGSAPDAEFEIGPGERVPVSRAQLGEAMAHIRELHEQKREPSEGLRERKKRLTRQLISDTATWMFCERGFDNVRVSEVAAEVGVSEKTVFNYFPTKESLVFDREDDLVAGIRSALTDREPGESPTEAMVAFIERECAHMDQLGEEFRPLFLAFIRMIDETPALEAARQQSAVKLVATAQEALAASVGVDPRDPEPFVAAQALMALWEVQLRSRERHLRDGMAFSGIKETVLSDVRRAARLLDTGLWSINQVAQGASARSQLAAAATAANEARAQVFEALKQARAAWSAIGGADGEAARGAEGSWWDRHRSGDEDRERRRAADDARRRAHVRAAREQAEARGETRKAEKLAEAEARMADRDARRRG